MSAAHNLAVVAGGADAAPLFSPARQGVIDATTAIEAAADALASAEAAHALAVETAQTADAKVQAVAEAEQEAATDLATRIKSAIRAGKGLQASVPSANAASRASAEAEAASAHRAVRMLAGELEGARRDLEAAQDAQRLATQAVVAEAADEIVNRMEAAFAVVERGYFDLRALENAGFTNTAAGGQRLAFTGQALRFLRWELQPGQRAASVQAALVENWRAWRGGLVTDPLAEPPAGEP